MFFSNSLEVNSNLLKTKKDDMLKNLNILDSYELCRVQNLFQSIKVENLYIYNMLVFKWYIKLQINMKLISQI